MAKHPPKHVWVTYCTRCGEPGLAGKAPKGMSLDCVRCAVVVTVKMARYRLVTAPGSEK